MDIMGRKLTAQGGAPDVVVGLARRGDQIIGKGEQGLAGAVPSVRLVVLNAMDIDLVMPLPEHPDAWKARDLVLPAQLHLCCAVHLHRRPVIIRFPLPVLLLS